MNPAPVVADLASILGPDGLICDAAEKRRYEAAARYGDGAALCVARPADTAEVSAVISTLVRGRAPFVIQSGHTGLALGATPDASGRQAVVSLERLVELEIDARDRVIEAGAGVRLSALNAALEDDGLFLPIDLGADPMIGGLVATNAGGARFVRYGGMRRCVLGLEVVLLDDAGTVLSLGRGLRKDNAQLPLEQLFIGSCGALGVITRVTAEVQRRPRQTATALITPAGDVADLLCRIEAELGDDLAALEGMSRNAMASAFSHVPALRNPFAGGHVPDYAILVELCRVAPALDGEPGLQDRLEAALGHLLEEGLIADAIVGPAQPLWALRHALSEGLRAAGPVVGFDLSLRRANVFAFRAEAAAMIARDFPQYEVCDFGHIADGGVHFNLVDRSGEADAATRARLRHAVLDLAVDGYGGSFSGEHGFGRAFQDDYERYTPAPVQALSGALQGLLAPRGDAPFRLSPPFRPTGDR